MDEPLRAEDLSEERIARLSRKELYYVAKHLLAEKLSMEQVSLVAKRMEEILANRE